MTAGGGGLGSASDDEASSSTRLLVPDGEGRPTSELMIGSTPPQPCATGTANVLSPWTVPLTTSAPSTPFGLGVPSGSNWVIESIAFERSVFAGCRTIGSCSEPMKQVGPKSTGVWLSRWILVGSVTIGTPTESPAIKSKSVGVPADSTVAVAVRPLMVTSTGSPTSAPAGGAMKVKVKVLSSSRSPPCRLLFPVAAVGVLPILMLPCVEFEATQSARTLTPSAASIAGSSTGQRLNGVQAPGPAWNVWSAPVVVPAEFVATTRKW